MRLFFGRRKKEEEVEKKPWEGIEVKPVPQDYKILDRYPIREGYVEIVIAAPPDNPLDVTYFVNEVPLNRREVEILERLKDFLSKELEPPKVGEEEDVKKIMLETAEKLMRKYGRAFGQITEESKDKIFYYLERDMLGFGPLNAIMEDHRIEDVSCDGVNVPVYVWHRDYESMPTNIIFKDRDVLDDFIIQLAHKSGKHISSAFPILDAMIYGKHRLAATFREEISPRGSTFTIRKFREKPFSIIELIQSNLMSTEIAAYFWLLLENKMNIMIAGATGSGKTTLLNALTCFIRPRMKIITCEETAELNIPSENWVRFVTRESFGLGAGGRTGEITLFDLVRTSLRYRPDYLIVGEVRGEEAFVLFQALATGHGGLSTIHAESIESAVKRLVSPPMNIPKSHISLMDAFALIERVYLPKPFKGKSFGRRLRFVWEIVDYEKYVVVARWDPLKDNFRVDFSRSTIIDRIALRTGRTREEILGEIWNRTMVLEWMLSRGITEINEVARIVQSYYANPREVLREVGIAERPEPLRVEQVASPTSGQEAEEEELQEGLEEAAEAVVRTLRSNNNSLPMWQIFVRIPMRKDLLVKALNKLKEEKVIDIVGGIVRLAEEG